MASFVRNMLYAWNLKKNTFCDWKFVYYFLFKCHDGMFKIKYIRYFVACVIAYLRPQCVYVVTWNENTKRNFFMHWAKSCHAIVAFDMELNFSWIPANLYKDGRNFKTRVASIMWALGYFVLLISHT
jgi:hypothetical protein